MELKSEDKVFAALAHLAILANWIGLLAVIALFFWQKDRSRFVAHHAKQAAGWQAAALVGSLVLSTLLVGTAGLSALGGAGMLAGLTGGMGIAVVLGLVFLAFAIIAAVKAFQGQEYTLPLIGRLVESIGGVGRAPGA